MRPQNQQMRRSVLPCAKYTAGHQVHWIQWKLCSREGVTQVAGRLTKVHDDGSFLIDVGGEAARRWNHDPERLRELVESRGADVVVMPDLHALVVDGAWVNYSNLWPTACQPREVWTSRW